MTDHPSQHRPSSHGPIARITSKVGVRLLAALQRHIGMVSLLVIGLALLAAPFAANRGDAEEPNMDPEGELYDVMDLVDDRFNTSAVVNVPFVVEARNGNALARDVLLEWSDNAEQLLAGEAAGVHLATGRVAAADGIVDGLWSIADIIDDQLAAGLRGSTEAEVQSAVAGVLDRHPTVRQSLGEGSGRVDGTWRAPAFMATLVVDNDSFPDDVAERLESGESAAYFGVEAQEWIREAQDVLQGDESTYRAIGAGFDGGLAFTEQLATAAPFILMAIVAIVLLVGVLLRSYWAAGVVVVALASIMLLYGGILDLAGFKGGTLLGFIVPVAGIAFGVDFFIHAVERIREDRGLAPAEPVDAVVRGLRAVAPALMIALASSVVAFLSNTVSGVEGIVEFGFGAAVLLGVSFVVLGFAAPAVVAQIESEIGHGSRASLGRRVARKFGLLALAVVGGIVVTMAIVAPIVGAGGTVVVATLLVGWPLRRARRRSDIEAGQRDDDLGGSRSGSRRLGGLVAGLARGRVIVLPVVAALAVAGTIGFTRVDSDFDFTEFYSEDSEFVEGIQLLDEHFGASAGAGEGLVFIEGDLTDPAVLATIDRLPAAIAEHDRRSDATFLARDLDDDPIVAPNVASLVRAASTSATARADVRAATGVTITDRDGDGLADDQEQIRAIVEHATVHGVRADGGGSAFTPESARVAIVGEGSRYATTVRVGINSMTDDAIVGPARAALEEIAERTAATHPEQLDRVAVSGATLVSRDSLNSFTDAMRIALPIAFVACVLLVALVLRSVRDAVVAVSPSLLVVVWVYAFMDVVGMSVNVVTATIAAIAIGVGLDYSTHFTMRYREELARVGDPIEAVRRAGSDTGGALAISALSSIVGFGIMALSPMPIFATFGLLTAVMVLLSLTVSLFVLPSLLVATSAGRRAGGSAGTAGRTSHDAAPGSEDGDLRTLPLLQAPERRPSTPRVPTRV